MLSLQLTEIKENRVFLAYYEIKFEKKHDKISFIWINLFQLKVIEFGE